MPRRPSPSPDSLDSSLDSPGSPQGEQAEAPLPGYQPVAPLPGPDSRDPLPGTRVAAEPGGSPGSASSDPPPRTRTKQFSREKAGAYEAIARGLLQAAGGLLNRYLANRGDPQPPDDESWLPDDEDEQTIAPPLGRLAARKIPVGDGQNLSDLEDIGMAAVGLIAWGAKSATSMWRHWRDRRRQQHPAAAGAAVYRGSGEDGQ